MIRVIDEHHLQVGDRTWFGRFDSYDVEGEAEWKHRQFIVMFESKWKVSVVWSYCTYSDNHDLPFHFFGGTTEFTETPERVEAAILHADREGIQPDGDVFSYLTTEQLNTLLTMVSTLGTDARVDVLELAWEL